MAVGPPAVKIMAVVSAIVSLAALGLFRGPLGPCGGHLLFYAVPSAGDALRRPTWRAVVSSVDCLAANTRNMFSTRLAPVSSLSPAPTQPPQKALIPFSYHLVDSNCAVTGCISIIVI